MYVNVVRSIRRHSMLNANYNWFQFASGVTLNRVEDASIPSAAALFKSIDKYWEDETWMNVINARGANGKKILAQRLLHFLTLHFI